MRFGSIRSCLIASLVGSIIASGCSLVVPSASVEIRDNGVGPIKVGSIVDRTGPLAAIGIPMSNADRLAIADINSSGGVLGRPLELVVADSKSSDEEAALAAQQLADQGEIVVVHGGISSSAREVMRPIFRENEVLYFYNVLYEGGLCDRNTFVTGETPTQQLAPMLKWAMAKGKTKWYVVAADYNFGQISSLWAVELADQLGAEIVGGPRLFPLDQSDFASEMPRIESSGADLVISFLAGLDQLGFYEEWSESGTNESTTLVSTTFGFGEEQFRIGDASAGIIAAYPFFSGLGTTAANAFEGLWQDSGVSSSVTPAAVATWNGWHLWAAAVNAAGSLDRDAVIAALEAGVTYRGPAGRVSIFGGSHHVTTPMRLWQSDGTGEFTELIELSEAAVPEFEEFACNLIANPSVNAQFTP